MFSNENRFLFKFANKSIRRNAGRSFFIGFSVSLAVVIAVWAFAFFDGVNLKIERAVVHTNTGYFQVHEQAFSRTTDPSSPLPFDENLRKKFKGNDIYPSPELILDGNITAPEGSAALMVLGIEPQLHRKFLPIEKNMVAGAFLSNQDDQLSS